MLLTALLLFATQIVTAPAQEKAATETRAVESAQSTPSEAKPDKSTPDYYLNLRKKIVAAKDYNPYTLQMSEYVATELFLKTWEKDQEYFKALQEIKPFLDSRPEAIEANRLVAEAFELMAKHETGETKTFAEEQGKRFRQDYEGLINSILTGKDGLTQETAFWVISIAEQHEVMRHLKLKPGTQSLVQGKNGMYDFWETTDETGNKKNIYFDITHFMNGNTMK